MKRVIQRGECGGKPRPPTADTPAVRLSLSLSNRPRLTLDSPAILLLPQIERGRLSVESIFIAAIIANHTGAGIARVEITERHVRRCVPAAARARVHACNPRPIRPAHYFPPRTGMCGFISSVVQNSAGSGGIQPLRNRRDYVRGLSGIVGRTPRARELPNLTIGRRERWPPPFPPFRAESAPCSPTDSRDRSQIN